MVEFYIEYTKTVTEVYRVEANSEKEAKEKVQKNHNRNAPNIVNRKDTEGFRVVNGMYYDGKLTEQFKGFYQ